MRYLLMIITLFVGAIIPVQAILNARMGKQIGGALMGSFMSFFVGMICLLILNLIINPTAFILIKPTITPWYIWFGGAIGAIFVGYITWVNQIQGVALTFALVVSGQILISVLIDHFGLFGSTIRTITLEKIIGGLLIISGIFLIKK